MKITKTDLIAKSFTSTNQIRPEISHIKMEQTETHRIATATDSYRGIRISTESPHQTPGKMLLNKEEQKTKLKKKEVTIRTQQTDSPDPDNYPNFGYILDQALKNKESEEVTTISISPKYLLDAAKALKQLGGEHNEYIEISINPHRPHEPIIFTKENKEDKTKMEILIMPIR